MAREPFKKAQKQGMTFMAIEGQEDKGKLRQSKEIDPKTTKEIKENHTKANESNLNTRWPAIAKMWKNLNVFHILCCVDDF